MQRVNQTISTLPRNTDGGTNPDPGFNPPPDGEMPVDSGSTLRYDDWSPTETPPAVPDSTATTPAKPGSAKTKTKTRETAPAAQPAPAKKVQKAGENNR
ncbi:MAG: hypothetical protein IPM98_10415 [Lewinellaceae bacterium]|nr:hypothetical protein [Lewinellaceae bacterium]